jgi:uncharacterized protein YgiM (DUF1202 family)
MDKPASPRRAPLVRALIPIPLVLLAFATLGGAWSVRTADAATEFAVGDEAFVDTDRLNLRDAPGLSADVVAVLEQGLVVTVTGGPSTASGYTWYEVETGGGSSGWVAGLYLSPTETNADYVVGDRVEVADGPLNLRDGAGLDADVLAQLVTGAIVEITDGPQASDGYAWYEVDVDGVPDGWVAGEFLAPAPVTYEIGDAVRIVDGPVNFRAGPGLDADILDQASDQALFQVRADPVDADGYTWLKVFNYFYGTGWVAAEFVDIDPNGFPTEGGS